VPSGCLHGADSATDSAFLLDFDHLAKCGRVQSTDRGRRSASGPNIPLARDATGFHDSMGDTAPRIARPLGQARESAFNTVRDASGPASSTSVPAVGFRAALRASTPGITQSLGHTQRMCLWDRAPPSATRASIGTMPSGEGLLATAGPFTRSPRRRNAVVHGFPVGSMSPVGRPSRGNSPGRAYPACTPLEAAFSSAPERGESGVFWGTRPLGRLPRGASISFHTEACRDPRLLFGSALGGRHHRRVGTFWFRPSLRATTLGPGHPVRAVPRRRDILDFRSRRPTTLRGRLFVGA
jgi:hypothetical protein